MNSLNKSSEILLAEMTSEDTIRKELDDVTLYFDYQETDTETELSLITISKNHGERFLFHKTSSINKLICLGKMIDYIQSDYKKNFQNYEIVWRKKGDSTDNISWFNGKSFLSIIDKFYFMKDPSDILIYEVKMKPMA
jgi:hypothetical protein